MADDSKQRILDAAFAEFSANGKAGARMQAIAERAQVNQAMLNYYFKSKDELYAAVIREFVSEIHRSHLESLQPEGSNPADSRAFWLHHIEHDIRSWEKNTDFLRLTLLDLLAGGEGMRMAFREWLDASQSKDAIASIATDSGIRNRNARQVILLIMSLSMFNTLLEPLADEFWPSDKSREELLDERIAAIKDLLEHGLFNDSDKSVK
ncbi:MAG: TetR/AcrR family transcriptional regulator [Calditrichota bacterium]